MLGSRLGVRDLYPPAVPRFQLVLSPSGEALAPVELPRTDWRVGSIIRIEGEGPNLRVVDRINTHDPEVFAILVVELAA